ncbi:hypothetical protein SRA_02781 [Streptococcus ratti FA-1 = DSM 20564]|uniref:Transposase n=1 Tax=Streptococcus ratti FA-1 = DSM 20564 TaxID=699248 RepID=A0ABN0GSL2_STRRT|nr:hypothetical protein SRA_02781 [Streptococcus ratti FA-1 = DSM 20564]
MKTTVKFVFIIIDLSDTPKIIAADKQTKKLHQGKKYVGWHSI